MQVLNAVFGIILARILTQADYGLVGMLTIFTAIAGSLQDSGFVSALVNRRNVTHADFNSVFWFNIGVSACMYITFFLCAPLVADFYHEPLLTDLFRYYSLGFLAASFSIVPRAILFKQLKQKELAQVTVLALLVSGIVGVTMALNGMAYWGIATQGIVYTATISLLSWIISGWRPSLRITFRPIREMIGFSSKMLVTSIFTQINNNIFSIVLGKFYTKNEVGTYNQANKWNIMGSSMITGMVQGVAQPTFVQVGDDNERLCRAFSKMLRFTCFVSFPAMFGLALVAPEFIVLLITDKWLPSAELMRILCIGGAFLPISTLYFNMIISQGRSSIYMWNIICQGILLLMTVIGIHLLGGGIREMVIANVAIIVLWTGIWHWFVRNLIGFSIRQALRDTMPFLMIAALTMVATYFLTAGTDNMYLLLFSRIAIAAVIYVAALWIFGARILRESLGFLLRRKVSD
ncbi:MAG: lipopolysaccharide biosynthesis protein [Bacteroidaceae bacterium]|nr:lipopolysaccharide biosynthesis protein [Bacteroidaceae bacterium]